MDQIRVIFILGTGHCGSTLLDLLLGSHSKMLGIGEVERMEQTPKCTCGYALRHCNFWSELYLESFLRSLRLFRKPLDFIFGNQNYLTRRGKHSWKPLKDRQQFIKDNLLFYKTICNKSGKEIIVDSSKNIDRAELLAAEEAMDVFLVHIVRDGRAVTWSYMKKYNKALFYAYSWLTYYIKITLLKKRTTAGYIRVEYEDLVKKPELELKRILNALGYEFEPSMMEFRSQNNHQVGGNDMRFHKTVEIREDRDWIERMPLRYKILFKFFAFLKKSRYSDGKR
ncbi:MAG: sulfotransferase [Desulfotignum sp.]|nr:sulfotransferase [Desulfotignum sp.]MCF8086440.1 sulfotransferase [Desulfotignum sp.]MCF8135842.1 sulfotransferase [Desulfotignum sp.]